MEKVAMGTMCMQGFQQDCTGLTAKMASRDSPSVKLATYKLSQQDEP